MNMLSLHCIMSRVKERKNIYFLKIIICILGMFTKSSTYTCGGKLIFVRECVAGYKNWDNISRPFQHSRLKTSKQIAAAQLCSINMICNKQLNRLNFTSQ